VKFRPWIKLPRIWKLQLERIIVKYCTGMLINFEGVVNPEMAQLKIGMGPQLAIRKELMRDGPNILRIC
jgi:hypothetical protein